MGSAQSQDAELANHTVFARDLLSRDNPQKIIIRVYNNGLRISLNPFRYKKAVANAAEEEEEKELHQCRLPYTLACYNKDVSFQDFRDTDFTAELIGVSGHGVSMSKEGDAEAGDRAAPETGYFRAQSAVPFAELTDVLFSRLPPLSPEIKRVLWMTLSVVFFVSPWILIIFIFAVEEVPRTFIIPGVWCTLCYFASFAITLDESRRSRARRGAMPCATVIMTMVFSFGCLGIFFPVLIISYENKQMNQEVSLMAMGTMILQPVCIFIGMMLNLTARFIRVAED